MHSALARFFLVLVLSAAALPQHKTYYVDAVNGSDAATGLTPSDAWRSLDKVNATVFQPGDSILLKAGCSWTGQLKPKGSGTAAAPIIMQSYGDGPRPLIDGAGIIGQGVLYLINQEYWEISSLEITNDAPTAGDRRGVNITAYNVGLLHHIYLKNLVIHNIKGIVGDTEAAKNTAGIGIEVMTDDNIATRFDDILIEGCLIYNIENTGLYTQNRMVGSDYPQSAGWLKRRFTNLRVRNNVIHHISKNAMIIRLADKGVIEYNTCYETALGTTGNTMFTVGCDGTVFQYNEGYFNRSPGVDGSMYDADLRSPNTVWQYSYSHNNAHGLMWFWTEAADSGITVRYNISQNDNGYLVAFRNSFKSAYVYNNVFYIDSSLSPTVIYELSGQTQKYTFANNIIYNNSATASYYFKNAVRTIDYNVFFGKHPLSEPNDAHKSTANPLFVAPGTGLTGTGTLAGYKLQNGSPAINTGIQLFNHPNKDFWGNSVPAEGRVDRGAFEFSTTALHDQVTESSGKNGIAVYPNPVSGFSKARFTVRESGHASVVVTDMLGREVETAFSGYMVAATVQAVPLRLQKLAPGVYLVLLRSAGEVSAIKIVVR